MPKQIKVCKRDQNCPFNNTLSISKQEDGYDFWCQYNVKSNHSLEIITHVLSRSTSDTSSVKSVFTETTDPQQESKQPSLIHMFISNLVQKFKIKKLRNLRSSKENKVLVYRVPKKIRISSYSYLHRNNNNNKEEIIEKPLIIRDESTHASLNTTIITRPPNKICGPGEILSLLKLKESGRVRHVGVSNMNEEQVMRLCAVQKPACLQIEVHALCQQAPMLAAAARLGIPVVAYSPLGSKALAESLAAKTGREYPSLLELPTVTKIAAAHSRTPAQVLLRHLLQRGVAAIPKSTDPSRIKQNISVWDFELNDAEMAELAALDRGEDGRICDFSFFAGVEKHPEFPFKR